MGSLQPVYHGYFADPFAWEHDGLYYAIGTGASEAAGSPQPLVFPLLTSQDFQTWTFAGHALRRPDPAFGDSYWAPEVAYWEGRFYLYYSVGHGDKQHQIRVAVSDQPLGPYEDQTQLLYPTPYPFAIDPHPFQDQDGQWYLFYACDFLDSDTSNQQARVGTGLMVDRLVTMTQLAGTPQVVLRARSDWQRFLADRPMYGGIYDWHTLEGACVRRHQGRYYCFYSGGRWETENYGVDYGVADGVMGPYSDAGNGSGARVLRSIPGQLIGPGHNSIVRGPDQTEYLVYHAWNPAGTERQIYISPLTWTPDGPRCYPVGECGFS